MRITAISVPPSLVCSTQSSPCWLKTVASPSAFQALSTAGWGVPEALRLSATNVSNFGVESGSLSSPAGMRSRKSRCGATP